MKQHTRYIKWIVIAALALLLPLTIGIVLINHWHIPNGWSLMLLLEENNERRWQVFDVHHGLRLPTNASLTNSMNDSMMQISPNGQYIASPVLDVITGAQHINLINRDGSNIRTLGVGDGWDTIPRWSPDSSQIVFVRERNHSIALFMVDIVTGIEQQITDFSNEYGFQVDWSPDGSRIVFTTSRHGSLELYTYIFATGEFQRLTNNEPRNDFQAQFSPSGEQIAYVSNHSMGDGAAEIWLMNMDGSHQQRLTSQHQNDFMPLWSPDGDHIVFQRLLPDSGGSNSWRNNLWLYDISTRQLRAVTNMSGFSGQAVWSPDSRFLTYVYDDYARVSSLWIFHLDNMESRLLLAEPFTHIYYVREWLP